MFMIGEAIGMRPSISARLEHMEMRRNAASRDGVAEGEKAREGLEQGDRKTASSKRYTIPIQML